MKAKPSQSKAHRHDTTRPSRARKSLHLHAPSRTGCLAQEKIHPGKPLRCPRATHSPAVFISLNPTSSINPFKSFPGPGLPDESGLSLTFLLSQ